MQVHLVFQIVIIINSSDCSC